MKKIIFLITYFSIPILFINAQNVNLHWARQFGGSNNDCGYSIAFDTGGNVYTTGAFQGTVDFDPGPGTYNLTSAGSYDIFISKMGTSGNLIWAKQIGGSSDDMGYAITVDAAGNVYTTGYFQGTVDFDPGPGTYNLTSTGYSMFIIKLDVTGNFVWAKHYGGTSISSGIYGNSISVDNSGNVYTTGEFVGTVDFNPGTTNYNLTSAGNWDIFVNKSDASGNFIWAKRMGGIDEDQGISLAVDATGNVYTTGYFMGTADFDPGTGTYNLTSSGYYDIFISKLNASGNFIWAKRFGSSGNDIAYSIDIDAMGNVYTTGEFDGTVDFDPGSGIFNLTSVGYSDIFIGKLDPSGNYIWAKQLGGSGTDIAYSIDIDAMGNVYTTGEFNGTANFDPGTGSYNLNSYGNDDIFISKLDSSGNFLWALQLGGVSTDQGKSITVDLSGNVYTTGFFKGTADFDPGPGIFYLSAQAGVSDNSDVFVLKLSQCYNSTSVLNLSACESLASPSGAYNWTSSGTYSDTISNFHGCDSIITINLTINHASTNTISPFACESYITPDGNSILTTSGTYLDSLVNSTGCDSIITINLTIINNTTNIITTTACDSYTSPSGNYTWTSSGLFSDTLINSQGCDSLINIDLTILNTASSINPLACESFISPSGNYTWSTSGTYFDTIPNSQGCDSILTIQLTILNSTSDTISPASCDSYNSPSGNYTWSTSGTYYDTIPNSSGCDSIIIINLTVNASSTNIISPNVCNSYTGRFKSHFNI